jgi:hypothetical protein
MYWSFRLKDVLFYPFQGIIAKQFNYLKFADRFYYENGESPSTRFISGQLNQIRTHSLSKLYCDNLGLAMIKVNSFETIHTHLDSGQQIFQNKLVMCNTIPGVDLSLWSDQLSNKKSG